MNTPRPGGRGVRGLSGRSRSGVPGHAGASIAGSDPDAVATSGLVAVEEMVEVPPKGGGIKLPEPVAVRASIVLTNGVDEQVLAWHRGVSGR